MAGVGNPVACGWLPAAAYMAVKLIVVPLLMVGCSFALGLSGAMGRAAVLVASLPVSAGRWARPHCGGWTGGGGQGCCRTVQWGAGWRQYRFTASRQRAFFPACSDVCAGPGVQLEGGDCGCGAYRECPDWLVQECWACAAPEFSPTCPMPTAVANVFLGNLLVLPTTIAWLYVMDIVRLFPTAVVLPASTACAA